MALDPTLAAAMVTAAGRIIERLLQMPGSSPNSSKAQQVIDKVYDNIAPEISTNCLRVLVVLRNTGGFMVPAELRRKAQELVDAQETEGDPFEQDIDYRLRFLALLGLIHTTGGGADYCLTELGDAYVERARKDRYRYTRVFFSSQ